MTNSYRYSQIVKVNEQIVLPFNVLISEERVANVSDKLAEGDMVKVKVLEVDKQGRVRLSIKAVEEAA